MMVKLVMTLDTFLSSSYCLFISSSRNEYSNGVSEFTASQVFFTYAMVEEKFSGFASTTM